MIVNKELKDLPLQKEWSDAGVRKTAQCRQ